MAADERMTSDERRKYLRQMAKRYREAGWAGRVSGLVSTIACLSPKSRIARMRFVLLAFACALAASYRKTAAMFMIYYMHLSSDAAGRRIRE